MTVYLDLVVGLNFLVDLLLLLGTNRLCGFGAGGLRTAGAALLGAVYAAVCMLPRFSFLGSTLWRLIFLGLMGILAFGMNQSAWKRTGIFVLLSMAMGGIAMGMGKGEIPMLLLSAASVWILCRIGFGGTVGGKTYMPITVTEGDRSVSVIALKDTGNSLRDPITGEQVLILSADAAAELTGLSVQQLSAPLETMVSGVLPGLRLVPYHSVGQGSGMMLAMRFDDVKIGSRRQSALIAFAARGLGEETMYQALTGGM